MIINVYIFNQSFLILCIYCKLWHPEENVTLTGSDFRTIVDVGALRSVAAVGSPWPHLRNNSLVSNGSFFHLSTALVRMKPSLILIFINNALPVMGLIPLCCGTLVIFLLNLKLDFFTSLCLFIHKSLMIWDTLVADHLGCSFESLL